MKALHGAFAGSYARANPDMQRQFGYEPDAPNEGNLAICSNQVSQRFDCLGLTLEMPFKDSAAAPRDAGRGEAAGFDGGRAASLGASLLDALAHVGPQLRGVEEPSFELEDDAYVAPTEDEKAIAAFMAQRSCDSSDGVVAVRPWGFSEGSLFRSPNSAARARIRTPWGRMPWRRCAPR